MGKDRAIEQKPNLSIITWTIIALNLLIFLWDCGWKFSQEPWLFSELAFHPYLVKQALKGEFANGSLISFFSSMFMHGNFAHLAYNLFALWSFGMVMERVLGSVPYLLFYLFCGLCADAFHLGMNLNSNIPMVGASGAIAGLMGGYLLLFPKSKLMLFLFIVPAWIVLAGWFALEIFTVRPGIANWAHVGGFLAGGAIIFLLGGQKRFTAQIEQCYDKETNEFYED
jgi:membrane associated rhomboid family serine protease